MKIKKSIFITGIVIFLGLIAAAIYIQSAYLLYAASVVPIVIVPLMPDIRSNQWLKPAGKKEILIYKQAPSPEDDPEFIVLRFPPGTVKWNRNILYFRAVELPSLAVEENTGVTTLTVLPYDLIRHPRKKKWYGIHLHNLIQRSQELPFKLKDVNRILIREEDFRMLDNPVPVSSSASAGRSLQA